MIIVVTSFLSVHSINTDPCIFSALRTGCLVFILASFPTLVIVPFCSTAYYHLEL